jgi:hypothetical protein
VSVFLLIAEWISALAFMWFLSKQAGKNKTFQKVVILIGCLCLSAVAVVIVFSVIEAWFLV